MYVFSTHPVETISRPFSAVFGPQVSKSTFGGTGVSDRTVPRNHLSVLASPSEAAILQRNNQRSVAEQASALRRWIVWRGAQRIGAGDGIVRDGRPGYANPSASRELDPNRGADACRPSAVPRVRAGARLENRPSQDAAVGQTLGELIAAVRRFRLWP